jgi:hypothetical protein
MDVLIDVLIDVLMDVLVDALIELRDRPFLAADEILTLARPRINGRGI